MQKRDLLISVVVSYGIGLFLIPTLITTNSYSKIPSPYLILYVVFPFVIVIGMILAWYLSKKIRILWQIAKFALIGVLNTAIDFGILNFLILVTNITKGASIGLINIPAFSIAVVNSYYWNRRWVFEGAKEGNFLIFLAITVIGLAVNTFVVIVITTYIPPLFGLSETLWVNVAKVFATGFSMVWNFVGYKLIVFKK